MSKKIIVENCNECVSAACVDALETSGRGIHPDCPLEDDVSDYHEGLNEGCKIDKTRAEKAEKELKTYKEFQGITITASICSVHKHGFSTQDGCQYCKKEAVQQQLIAMTEVLQKISDAGSAKGIPPRDKAFRFVQIVYIATKALERRVSKKIGQKGRKRPVVKID